MRDAKRSSGWVGVSIAAWALASSPPARAADATVSAETSAAEQLASSAPAREEAAVSAEANAAEPAVASPNGGGPGAEVDHGRAPSGRRPKRYAQRHVGLDIGPRLLLIRDEGFDPWSENDLLPFVTIGGSWTPLRAGPLSFGVAGEYDIGSKTGEARGNPTTFVLHRLAAGPEARFALGRRFSLFARVTPAVTYATVSIEDLGIDRPLEADAWSWAVDVTGGSGLLLGSVGDRDWPAVRFWLRLDLGYSFAGSTSFALVPEEDEEDPRRFGEVVLPAASAAGLTSRLTFLATF